MIYNKYFFLFLGQLLVLSSLAFSSYTNTATELKNVVAELLEKDALSTNEKAELLYAANASAYYWLKEGNKPEMQKSERLLTRVHSHLGNGDMAMKHAYRCREITIEIRPLLNDYDYAFSYEALARAHLAIGDEEIAKKYYKLAINAGVIISDWKKRFKYMTELHSGNLSKFRQEKKK